jgi:hypothetical protein
MNTSGFGNLIRVSNMKNSIGRAIPNQFIIDFVKARVFQSYETIIAVRKADSVTLNRDKWDYSVTTGKYRNIFLGEKKKETVKKIIQGKYKLKYL